MIKTIPFMLSIIAIASIASIAVLGNIPTAYAGSLCELNPLEVTRTLDKGESSDPITKMIDCSAGPISAVSPDSDDCDNKGIIFDFDNQIFTLTTWQIDEIFTNTGGAPGQTHCEMTFEVAIPGEENVFLVQQVWITTPDPVVGGEFLPIDSTALVLAGLQTSAIWMLPVLAGVAGSAFGILYIKSRRN